MKLRTTAEQRARYRRVAEAFPAMPSVENRLAADLAADVDDLLAADVDDLLATRCIELAREANAADDTLESCATELGRICQACDMSLAAGDALAALAARMRNACGKGRLR
jgi:hypothetical protein